MLNQQAIITAIEQQRAYERYLAIMDRDFDAVGYLDALSIMTEDIHPLTIQKWVSYQTAKEYYQVLENLRRERVIL